MTKKEFFNKVIKGKKDPIGKFIELLNLKKIPFCIIGGLAVNAYAEPVVSLDLDIVIIIDKLNELLSVLEHEYTIKKYPNSINITSSFSDLRIQIQTDKRHQNFIKHSLEKDVLGYKLFVASIEDVLKGKIWAAEDKERRPSKRQKDLADILRLLEVKKDLIKLIPKSIKEKLEF